MQQINFRISEDEKNVLDLIAQYNGQSVAEYTRKIVEKEISSVRIEIAFQLIQEGKIGFKRAWTLSGLTYHEFMIEWTKRGINEEIPIEVREKSLNLALTLEPKLFLKNPKQIEKYGNSKFFSH